MARLLWTQATGRDGVWYPGMPAQRAALDGLARQRRQAHLVLGGMLLLFFIVIVGAYFIG